MTQQNLPIDNKLFSIGDASLYLGVSIDTLRRWVRAGKLAARRSPGGHRYFLKEDLDGVFNTVYERYAEPQIQKTNKDENDHLSLTPKKDEETKNTFDTSSITNVREPSTVDAVHGDDVVTEVVHIEKTIVRTIPLYEKHAVILDRPTRAVYVPAVLPVPIISFRRPIARPQEEKDQIMSDFVQIDLEPQQSETAADRSSQSNTVPEVVTNKHSVKNVDQEKVSEEVTTKAVLHPLPIIPDTSEQNAKKTHGAKSDKKMYILIVIGVFILLDIVALMVWIFNSQVF